MTQVSSPLPGCPLRVTEIYVLEMVCPQWPSPTPDPKSLEVLKSLQARGLVLEHQGCWYISSGGRLALTSTPGGHEHRLPIRKAV